MPYINAMESVQRQFKLDFYTKLARKLQRISDGEMTLDDYIAEVKEKVRVIESAPTPYISDPGRQTRLAEYEDISPSLIASGRGFGKTYINFTWDHVKEIIEIRNRSHEVYARSTPPIKAFDKKPIELKGNETGAPFWEGHITPSRLLELYRKSSDPVAHRRPAKTII